MTKPKQTPSAKPKTSKKSEVRRSFWQRHRVASIVGIVFVVLYVISLFVPFVYPYTRFPLYVVKCGGLPVIGYNYASGHSYSMPGEGDYDIRLFFLATDLYCTPGEAEADGLINVWRNN